tara:strand:- start:657 stop:827 length:171 start_codon:yes stop_codon:yes gene_type:complete
MGDSQTSTSGTAVHRHSVTSSDGGALRTDTTQVQIEETATYMTLQEYTTVQGIVFG